MGVSGSSRWNTRRGTRTTPWYSPISTPNSTACRSAFQRASSGKVKNMRLCPYWGLLGDVLYPFVGRIATAGAASCPAGYLWLDWRQIGHFGEYRCRDGAGLPRSSSPWPSSDAPLGSPAKPQPPTRPIRRMTTGSDPSTVMGTAGFLAVEVLPAVGRSTRYGQSRR
jgi:hypothetical protein